MTSSANRACAPKSIAILNSQSPFKELAKEALDVALMFGSFEQAVSLFFSGEGVRQLVAGQQLDSLGMKNFLATFAALKFYDIENIYVCQHSLTVRSLSNNFHIDFVQLLNQAEFSAKLHAHQIIYRF